MQGLTRIPANRQPQRTFCTAKVFDRTRMGASDRRV